MGRIEIARLLSWGAVLYALVTLPGCDETQPASIPDRPATAPALAAPPPPKHANRGTGRLRHTRFAQPPIVTVDLCRGDRRKCGYINYAVFARLTRDVPRRPSGLIAAAFDVNGLDYLDPIGRMSRPRFCFEQSFSTSYLGPITPRRVGASVVLTLTSYDTSGHATGTLATTVRLSRPETRREENDYRPPSQPVAVGC